MDAPAVLTDLSHTFTELAGLPPMPTAADGLSLAPLLLDGAMPKLQERPLYFGTGDARAVRVGDWKYIATTQPPWKADATPDPRLYNLSMDLDESDNLLEHYPDVADLLEALLDAFNAACQD
jgi:arylsulfatase A-like enzyme